MLKNSISYKIISINIFAERVDSTLFFFLRKSRLNSTEPKPNKPEATEMLQDFEGEKNDTMKRTHVFHCQETQRATKNDTVEVYPTEHWKSCATALAALVLEEFLRY